MPAKAPDQASRAAWASAHASGTTTHGAFAVMLPKGCPQKGHERRCRSSPGIQPGSGLRQSHGFQGATHGAFVVFQAITRVLAAEQARICAAGNIDGLRSLQRCIFRSMLDVRTARRLRSKRRFSVSLVSGGNRNGSHGSHWIRLLVVVPGNFTGRSTCLFCSEIHRRRASEQSTDPREALILSERHDCLNRTGRCSKYVTPFQSEAMQPEDKRCL